MDNCFRFRAEKLDLLHRVMDSLSCAICIIVLYSIFSPSSFFSNGLQIAVLVATASLFTAVCFHVLGVYQQWSASELIPEWNRIIVSALSVFGFLLIVGYVFKVSSIYSRSVVLLWIFVWPLFICAERFFLRKFFFSRFFETTMNKKAVIVGSGKLGAGIADWIAENPWAGVNLEGFFDRTDVSCDGVTPCLGKISDLPGYVKDNNIQMVYLALPMREEALLNDLLVDLEDSTAQIFFFPDMSIFKKLMGSNVAQVAGQVAISLRSSPFSGMNGVIKRLEDIILSLLIILLISPVMLAVAFGIKLTSRGPVLFKQWRYGLGGEPFQIYKFRTMKVLEDGYEFKAATKNDPRVTAFGCFLRKNSLDELPQFFNVLLGSMSIVGPRPHAVKMNEEYRLLVQGYMLRHISKPGITGLAQINGYKGEVSTDEDMKRRIFYDIEYLQRWSVFFDFEIILKTIFKFSWRQ